MPKFLSRFFLMMGRAYALSRGAMPKFPSRFFQVNSTTVGLLLTAAMMLVFYTEPAIIQRLDLLISDIRFLARGPKKAAPDIVIATIDEKSIDQLGRWPWPYTVQAKLLDRLVSYGARVITYDVVFSSSDTSGGIEGLRNLKAKLTAGGKPVAPETIAAIDKAIVDSDHDRIFAEALKRSGRTILGYFFHFSNDSIKHLTEAEMKSYLENIRKSKYGGIKKTPGASLKNIWLPQAVAVESNLPAFASAARGNGYFSVQPDADGAVRRIPLIVKYRDLVEIPGEQDYLFGALTVLTLERYLRGRAIFWIDPFGVEKVAFQGRKRFFVPTNGSGEMFVNYIGDISAFPTYSIVDIVEGRQELAPPQAFRDKIVLIGPTAIALADLRVTPFNKAIPGVAIHATVLDNMLRGDFLSEPGWAHLFTGSSVLLLGLLGTLLFPLTGAVGGGVGAGVALAGVVALNQFLFARYGWWLSAAYPILTGAFLYGGMTLYRYVVEEQQKRFIQSAFGTYLSPKVVAEIVSNPSILKLGGERKEITAFFSDVAGFTSVSESMSPEELVALLNEYLSEMTDILLKYDGTVDKYEGDAIVAFLGAPHPMPDHAERSCLVGLDMQEAMVRLRAAWRERGTKELYMRIGLNTGPAVVGNMGSRTRMDYTMMGDTVNTAARFEGANKEYGSSIMIGPVTYEQSKHAIEARELDLINVVGKKEPIPIYELLGRKGQVPPQKMKAVELYHQGLVSYRARRFDEAMGLFSEGLISDKTDNPCKFLVKRCERYLVDPPPKNWNGAFIMTSK
ncbi:MAG: adenylate/guanylate cyclase domain-containing protein [Candidatus Tectomicrobia bacterium]|nr:adenylate/guanylate cyclase domain-containing protein [Candidatus Tectomicrobia bacterium]